MREDCIKGKVKHRSMGELCNHWAPTKGKRDGEWRETATNTTADDNTEHLSSAKLPGTGI